MRVLACTAVVLCLAVTTIASAQVAEQKELRTTALFSPDGSVVALAIKSPAGAFVELRSAGEYNLLHKFIDGSGPMEGLAFSRNSKELAAGCRDGNVYVWSVATGRLSQTLVSRRESKGAVAWLPDGSGWVALASEFRDERARTCMTTWNLDGELQSVRQIEGASALANGIPFFNGCALLRRRTKDGFQLVEVPFSNGQPERAFESPVGIMAAIPCDGSNKLVIAGGTSTPTADGKGRQLSPGLVVLDAKINVAQHVEMDGEGDYSRALALDAKGTCAYFAWPGPWISPAGQPGILEATKLLSAWDVERNTVLWTSTTKFYEISSIARAPKGRDLICCDRRGVWLVDAESGEVLRELR